MNYVDAKISVWNRLEFDDDIDMNDVLSVIREKGIPTIYEKFGVIVCKTLYETEQLLTLQQNAGKATIEVYEKDKLKWDNSMNATDDTGR